MEALIREGKLSCPGEVMLRFALGKEYEDLDGHARAFDHVEAGSQSAAQFDQPRQRAEIAEIDRIIRTRTRAWLSSCPPGFSAADPIFVVGLPRTGTTLVERIIASHSAMISAGETGAFAVELRRATKTASNSLDVADIGRRYVGSVAAFRVPPNRRFVDKTLQNYLYCGIIHAALPRAKIILIHDIHWTRAGRSIRLIFRASSCSRMIKSNWRNTILAFRRLARHWKSTLPSHVCWK